MKSSAEKDRIDILYLTRDNYPTFRVDIAALFGKYLPKLNIHTTIVAPTDRFNNGATAGTMRAILHNVALYNRYFRAFAVLIADMRVLWHYGRCYDVIQVRNKILPALFAIATFRRHGAKVCYWMSYPYAEDDMMRARENKTQLGLFRAAATFLRGLASRVLLYRVLLPLVSHVFVQSSRMNRDVRERASLSFRRISIVPMGVDLDALDAWHPLPVRMPAGRIIVYLGAMDRARGIDFIFEALRYVASRVADVKLVLVGDCTEKADWRWLIDRARELGIDEKITKTGWVDRKIAWSYLHWADLGVCALPDKFTFNSMSPTKAVEMLALGLSCVVTEHPEQGDLVHRSGGGIVTPYDVTAFAAAVCRLLQNPVLREQMGDRGRRYIAVQRSYERIAEQLENVYRNLTRETANFSRSKASSRPPDRSSCHG